MKFLRKIAKYTLFDHKRNQGIVKELKTESVLEKSTITGTDGYKTFAGWTDLYSRKQP
jgi:hypothetical protein